MECKFAPTGKTDRRGWRQMKCNRRECKWRMYTPHPPEMCHAQCTGWPDVDEPGYWLKLHLAAAYVTISPWAWIRFRLGLTEVPECNCDARARWLNTIGGNLCRSTSRLGKWLAWLLVRRTTPSQNQSPESPAGPA